MEASRWVSVRHIRALVVAFTAMFWTAAAGGLGLQAQNAQQASIPAGASASTQRAVLDRYCVTCHNQRLKTAGLAIDTLDTSNVARQADVWEKVIRKLRGGQMPPAGSPRPDQAGYDALAGWLESEVDRAASARPNPGRTQSLHRLNRAEYQRVIRDLLGVEFDVTSLLPADDASYGFDNIAGVLKLSDSLLERYLTVAEKVSRAAIGASIPAATSQVFRVSEEARQYEHVPGLPFGTRGGLLARYIFPQDGTYEIKVLLMCRIAGECDGALGFADRHELEILVDGERVQGFTLEPRLEPDPNAPPLQVRIPVKAGPHDVGVTFLRLSAVKEIESQTDRFLRPYYLNGNFTEQQQSIWQPFVDTVTISGPFDTGGAGDTPSRRKIFVCRSANTAKEAACARTILSTLARRAYRRPATEADLTTLLKFYADGRADGDFDAGIQRAMERLLVSPDFLFRAEIDPPGVSAATSSYRISDLELASRLSFFLWSSVPDEELLQVANRGRLRTPAVLDQQVRRMLADPRSEALVTNFVGQWLQLRNLEAILPSIPLFPDFDDTLRQSMRRETELFFESILRENRSALDLLTADYTFVNERLALHYGIPNVKGSHFRRVTLSDSRRSGLLGKGSILTVTSRPNRTSPVLRGKWILENLLGTPPPAPPANVPPFPERKDGSKAAFVSVRESMAQHRANPTCASCHSMIDPVGFALENFDAVGRWRDVDEAYSPVDASGTLPSGAKFGDLAAFRSALVARPERFMTTLTEKLLTYALGRGLEYYDMPTVRRMVREAAAEDLKLTALISGIAKSDPFVMRKPGAPATVAGTLASAGDHGAGAIAPR